jgi:histidinol-phosphatase (PHP family)
LPTYDELARYCEYAASVGVDQIAITEHCNRFEEIATVALRLWQPDDTPTLRAAAEHVWETERGANLDEYVELLVSAQARGLPILVGLEVDYLPGANEAISEIVAAYPFDMLLGSVHWLGAWLFDAYGDPTFAGEWERRPTEAVWDAYVDAVIDLARSGSVDVIAHVDVIKVAGYRPADIAAFETRLSSALATSDVTVEVSSAGLRKPADEVYPSPRLLRMLHEGGVGLTTASDAHHVEHVGYRFDEVYASLRHLGVETLTTFNRRQRQSIAVR